MCVEFLRRQFVRGETVEKRRAREHVALSVDLERVRREHIGE